MTEAVIRNPAILLDGLQWGAPGWIGNGQFFSQDNADYIVRFIEKAKEIHGFDIDYAGVWNERPYAYERPLNNGWIKLLKSEFRLYAHHDPGPGQRGGLASHSQAVRVPLALYGRF